MYAIKFKPIYYERIWGGDSISKVLNRTIDIKSNQIGESWDIVDRKEACSVVSNGYFKDLTIRDLRLKFGTLIFGKKFNFKDPFPLLVKILDAKEDLSLQVHPKKTDIINLNAKAQSKTEYWYILNNQKDAKIYAGLSNNDKTTFLNNLESQNLKKLVRQYESKKNMLIYVPSGSVHSIGSGNLILEIQENSDTTYRVSDWGRVDKNGKKRELHIKESLQCIDFNKKSKINIKYVDINKTYKILSNELFIAKHYYINKNTILHSIDSPRIISLLEGSVIIKCGNNETFLNYGESALLPVEHSYTMIPITNNVNFLINKPCVKSLI